ncbi:E3 ubiquitin-protein ligase rnft1 [Vermiconidia calcicola]|uniref:E3 ubiquitin-protein ligase rnft1 n=1 Tax=Vermiconidia calcicola TaxID=1690605 RepID=A0ACC3MZL4_9PEZI|nr:E3 ubiquitin-protein ligase rnft1 [Vermiconidia calcicola]
MYFAGCIFVIAAFVFANYPTAFLLGFATYSIYVYLLNEHLFNEHFGEDAEAARAHLPSYQEWLLSGGRRYLMALPEDDCIVCRDEPTTPVKIPCNHVLCEDCLAEWFRRGNSQCPQCTVALFQSADRTNEKLVKLRVAATKMGMPLTLLDLIFGPVSRWNLIAGTAVFFMLWGESIQTLQRRREYGKEWWRRPQIEAQGGPEDDEDTAHNTFQLGLCAVWVVRQVIRVEWVVSGWVPAHFLWKVFCEM